MIFVSRRKYANPLCVFALVRNLMCMLFPVLTIEIGHVHRLRFRVKAMHIDVDAVGIRAWRIERFNTADSAESMFCYAGIERIG